MKAIVCAELGVPDTLQLQELKSASLKKGEVRVQVRAAGVNFPDTLIIQGLYQYKPEPPFTPGQEIAGEVLEVGEGVAHLRPGDPVMAVMPHGGYADEIVLPAAILLPLPKALSFEEAGAFPLAYGTTIHALEQRAQLKPKETLLVLGAAGGVGLAAVQIGKLMGANVIAAASSDEKLALCKAQGADHVINYSSADLREEVKKLTKGQGADVIYDPVGGDIFDQAVRCVNWAGRILVIGFASGRIPDFPANRALIKSCSLVGVFWGAFAMREPGTNRENFMKLAEWVEAGQLKPIVTATYPLANAADALNDMLGRKVTGKVVLTTGE